MVRQISNRLCGRLLAAALLFIALPASAQAQITLTAAAEGQLNDAEVLEKAPTLSVDQLQELLGAYDRLGKKAMAGKIADEILKKDGANARALRVKEGKSLLSTIPADGGSDDGGYNAPLVVSEADRFAARVDSLIKRRRYSELARVLAARKRSQGGGYFRYQEDLASAYSSTGNRSAARSAYKEIANSSRYSSSLRATARKAIADIDKDNQIDAGFAAIAREDGPGAMKIADGLLAKYPRDADSLVLKAGAHSTLGQHDEGLAILENLRSRYSGRFPYDGEVAGIHMAAGNFDEAEAIYSRMNNAAGRGGLRELKKARSLASAYEEIRVGRGTAALAIADDLAADFPNDKDVASLRGTALLAAGRSGEAAAELQAVKDQYYRSGYFPAQSDLALAHYKNNQLDAASDAYMEILDGEGYPAELRDDALIYTRDIRKQLGAALNSDVQWIDESEGTAFRTSVYGHTALQNGWRFWGWGHFDSIDLSSEAPLDLAGGERYEAGIAIERRSSVWNSALRLGASEDDLIAGVEFGRGYGSLGSWYFKGDYNGRADDSLSLEALDGREHKAEVGLYFQVRPRVTVDASLFVRQVELFGENIGEGYGYYMNVDYSVADSYGKRPGLVVGYAGEVSIFDGGSLPSAADRFSFPPTADEQGSLLTSDLIEEEINMHGVRAQIEGRLSADVSYYANGAIQYDFFDKEVQYSAGGGLEMFFSDDVSVTAGVEYFSTGQASSSGSGVVIGNLGLSIRF